MRLFINVIGSDKPNWEHFQYMINGEVTDETTTSLAVCRGNWNWETQQEISYRVEGSEMELAIPMASLGIKNVGTSRSTSNGSTTPYPKATSKSA